MNKTINNICFLIIFLIMGDLYSQENATSLHKKWLIYNMVSKAKTGWHSFVNNYVFDFTDKKYLTVKVLGTNDFQKVAYHVDYDKGEILNDENEVLYQLKKLESDILVLSIGKDQNNEAFLYSVYSDKATNNLKQVKKILTNHTWNHGVSNIEFKNNKFLLLGEIETDFKCLIESDNGKKKLYEGGWNIDIYDNILFLELYSSRYNFRAIYKIDTINDETIKASAVSNNGEKIFLDLSKKR